MRIFTQSIIIILAIHSFCLAQWEQTGEIDGGFIYVFTNDGSNLYAGTFLGVFKSSNYGNEWVNVNSGQLDSLVPALINYDDKIFASRYRVGLFVTTNAGTSWIQIPSGMTGQRIISFTRIGNNIFGGAEDQGVIMSSDGGTSWIQRNAGMGANPNVLALVAKENYLFAGTPSGVYRSVNNGESWVIANNGLPNAIPYSFGTDQNTIYIGMSENTGCYSTTDNGENWSPANTGLPAFPTIWSFANKNEFAFIGIAGSGVYLTTNSGNSWNVINEGLNDVDIRSIYIMEPYIFAGTWSGKVWRRLLSEVTTVNYESEVPLNFDLTQNYPNPFNPITKISYALPNASMVDLKIYNILGQLITTLVNEEKPAGFYEVDFNAADLPSGVYMYRITAVPSGRQAGDPSTGSGQGFVETKKMLLLK